MEDNLRVQAYRDLERQRLEVLRCHAGGESTEEDNILDRMDQVWLAMTPEERTYTNTAPGPYDDETNQWVEARKRE